MTDMPNVAAPVAAKPQEPQKPEKHAKMPQKFWQWLFIYPTFGLALLSAVPNWASSAREFWLELQGRPLEEALEQRAIFNANLECMQAPFVWHQTGTGLEVDATMCPATADLLLRFNGPNGPYMYGIDIDALTQQQASAGNWLVSAAYAQEAPVEADLGTFLLAQASDAVAIVQCVDQSDERTIVRHIKVGTECFDEQLDTLTGKITAQIPAQCKTSC